MLLWLFALAADPITVVDDVDGDDIFNVTAGGVVSGPGVCTCEKPKCSSHEQGDRLLKGDQRTFAPDDGCSYFSIGGGMVAKDGTHCVLWRADPNNCTTSAVGTTRECARVSGAKCTFDGKVATLMATIDRKCDVLPYSHCDPSSSTCCGGHKCAVLPNSSSTYICQPTGEPPALTVINSIAGDDLFNVTTGTPGSCSCETPKCNWDGSTGNRLKKGAEQTFNANGCAYFGVGGGIVAQDGNPCAVWRADASSCTVSPNGVPTDDCARVSGATCSFDGRNATLRATIDRACTLPYRACDPASTACCGAATTCALAQGSSPYYECQPKPTP